MITTVFQETVWVCIFASAHCCVFKHVYNLLSMMLLTLLVWNIRYFAIHPLAVDSDQNHKLQLWDASLITCGEVPVETSIFLCVSSEAGFLPTIPSGARVLWDGLFISKFTTESTAWCKIWFSVLFTSILYRWETSTHLFENLKEWQKWIHHLYNKKNPRATQSGHTHKVCDRNSSGTLHTHSFLDCLSLASLVIYVFALWFVPQAG